MKSVLKLYILMETVEISDLININEDNILSEVSNINYHNYVQTADSSQYIEI